jgi:hypothetical protein
VPCEQLGNGAGKSFVSFIPLFDRRLLWDILQPNPFGRRQRRTRLADTTKELWMVL